MSPLIKQGHVGTTEAIVITSVAVGGKILLISRMAAQVAATAGWMLPLINAVVTGVIFYLIVAVLDPQSGKGLVEQYERQAGLLGAVLLLAIALDYLALEGLSLRWFAGETRTTILPSTPVLAIEVVAFAAITYATSLGIETLGRASMLYGVPMAVTVLGLLAIASSRARVTNLLPLLGWGVKPLLFHGTFDGFYREIWVLGCMWPYLRERKKIFRIGYTAMAVTGLLQALVVAATLAVIPMPATVRLPFPVGEIARAAQLGGYLSNLEAVFTFLLAFIVMLHLSMVFWTALLIMADLLRIPNYRQLLPILTLAVLGVSLFPKGVAETITLSEQIRIHGSYAAYPLLLVVWLVSRLKRGTRREGAQGEAVSRE